MTLLVKQISTGLMNTFLIIAPEGGMLLEAVGIADILGHASRLRIPSAAPYKVTIATAQRHQVIHGLSGLNLLADTSLYSLDPQEKRHTIMVTGRGLTDEERIDISDWLRRAAPNAQRVVSVCGGALLLAQADLLNGRRATTHWRLLDTLQSGWPAVQVEKGPIYIQDGAIWTSAGVSSGFDLTLALVEEDHGFSLARDVAQDMVMFLRRPGGQSQFSRYLARQASTPGPLRELQAWILENLRENLTIESLAEKVAMSPRNFTRVFTRQTGTTPARFVEEARLDAARRSLEQGNTCLKKIAASVGFANSTSLRRVFARHLQVTPSEYRQCFGSRNLS